MKLGQFSRIPYEVKIKESHSAKAREHSALSPKPSSEFYASQDIYTILSPLRKEESDEKKIPIKALEHHSQESENEGETEPKDFKSKAREMLLEKVNMLGQEYHYSFDFGPSASFFKFLCARPGLKQTIPKLKMWVPDTIVYNDTDRPFWLYTNLNGEVCRLEGFNENDVMQKLPRTNSPSDISILLKKPFYDHKRKQLTGNTTVLVANEVLKDKVRMLQRSDGEKAVLQRYLQSHGIQRFICRSVYQKDRMPYGWLITANDPRAVITDATANIVRITSGKFLRDTQTLVLRLLKFLETYLKVSFEMIACDFIRDEGDVWWLINIKSFLLDSQDAIPDLHLFVQKGVIEDPKDQDRDTTALKEYTRQKRCEFCHIGFETLSHELTLKMIFEMEDHLRKRGKIVSWLENKEYRHIDEATLYQNYSVCDYCFKLYTETQILRKIENELAQAFSIPKKSDQGPVQEFELEPGIPLRVIKDDPTSHSNFSSLSKFRFLLVLNELQNANLKDSASYSLEYEFLGKIHKVKVPSGDGSIILSRLRLFYMFSNGRGKFNLFLKRQHHILIKLTEDGKEIFKVKLLLIDFKSPFVIAKYYCEHFGDRNSPVLTAHIGIVGEPAEKISDLTLRAFHEIYLPPEDYITCDPLPDEWLGVLPSIFTNQSGSLSLAKSGDLLLPSTSLSPKSDLDPHPVRLHKRKSDRIARSRSSKNLFQQRFDEINLLLQQKVADTLPIARENPQSATSVSENEDFSILLHIISANNLGNINSGFEVWRLQWTAFRSSKVLEKPIEYGLKSCWISYNVQVKFHFRAAESDFEKYVSQSEIEFKVCKASSKDVGIARFQLKSLFAEKYLEAEIPLQFGAISDASLTVTVSMMKEANLQGKISRKLGTGVHEVKQIS